VTCAGKRWLDLWEDGVSGVYQLRSSDVSSVKKRSVMNDQAISLCPDAHDKLFRTCKKNVMAEDVEPVRFASAASAAAALLASTSEECNEGPVGGTALPSSATAADVEDRINMLKMLKLILESLHRA
jgi:hypothetical protein